MIELIAIDLDGTLMNGKNKLSKANQRAIKFAQDQGIHVVICTGRPYTSTKPVLDILKIKEEDFTVVFNGGQIRQGPQGHILVNNDLSMEDFNLWWQASQQLDLPLNVIDSQWVYESSHWGEAHPSIYVSKVTTAPSKRVNYDDFQPDQRFNKFVIAIEDSHFLDQQINQMDPNLKKAYQLVKSYAFQLEVSRKGVSKGQALLNIGQRLAISPDNMLAIGDQNNDLGMMQVVGHRGAVGNAIEEIKALADYVGPTNNEDGVANIIYHFIN